MTKKKIFKLTAIILSIFAGIVSIYDAIILIIYARALKHSTILMLIDPKIYIVGYIAIVVIIFWAVAIVADVLCLIKKESRIFPVAALCLLSAATVLNIINVILLFSSSSGYYMMILEHTITTTILSAAAIALWVIYLRSKNTAYIELSTTHATNEMLGVPQPDKS